MMSTHTLGLDIGEKRVGIAVADTRLKFARPLQTAPKKDLQTILDTLIDEYNVQTIVVGYPRNLSGESTLQTAAVETIMNTIELPERVKVFWQDESLTSVKAVEILETQKKPYQKDAVDALAASIILDDFLQRGIRV